MNALFNRYLCPLILTGGLLLLPSISLHAQQTDQTIHNVQFEPPFLSNGQPFSDILTSQEVFAIHQDREGFIWLATSDGISRYDGYQIKNYKYPVFPAIDFKVRCLADDYMHILWIGTNKGLYQLNKITGDLRKIDFTGNWHEAISTLLVTRDGLLWIGNERGLYQYNPTKQSLQFCDSAYTKGILSFAPIKSMIEDSQGDVWIGTWEKGLYRYSYKEKKFFRYPPLNRNNSAHVLYEDHHHHIWVGTWAYGIHVLKNPRDMQKVSWETFHHQENDPNSLLSDIVYSLSSTPQTNTLWVGGPKGLSILNLSDKRFTNYQASHSKQKLPHGEVAALLYSQQNMMWVGTIGGGAYIVNTQPSPFSPVELDFSQNNITSKSIRRLFVDSKGWVWLALGDSYRLARCKTDGSQVQFWNQIPEFSHLEHTGIISTITERKSTGEIYFGRPNGIIFVYREGEKVRTLSEKDLSFLHSRPHITYLMEDSQGNFWFATSAGLYVQYNNGGIFSPTLPETEKFKLSDCNIINLFEDNEGRIWAGTAENGIICIQGNIHQPAGLKYTLYNSGNQSFPNAMVYSIYQDRKGELWIGTKGKGMFLYSPESNRFNSIKDKFGITNELVSNIQEDKDGNLWLGTSRGLVKFSDMGEQEDPLLRIYSTADGLQNSYPNPHTSSRFHGNLFFGGTNGFFKFTPHEIKDVPMKAPLVITDIKFHNVSIEKMDSALRKRISPETPEFTKRLTIPYQYNNFSIEFAALMYTKSQFVHYAFMLRDFDQEWQYVDGTQRSAHYNNLPAGKYTFCLKAASANGIWSGETKEIEIIILPPLWATWWAYLIYLIVFLSIAYFAYRTFLNRIRLKNQLRLSAMEQAKAEEMNHAKLQFFTNLTHELMTPLAILSASIDELRIATPEYKNIYSIMTRNVNRLIRHLQQILEFRKAESGNLKLQVSKGNLVFFLHNEVEAFRPLIKQRDLNLTVTTNSEILEGFFDPDKLDKILYNLLSNAAKYNREGGSIRINLTYSEVSQSVEISVSDDGKGISPEAQKNLFTRFYEGDYRRFKTIGTGIGLSLTKDLVTLHKGSISVESELNKGTTFSVIIPIGREAFDLSQIDEESIPSEGTVHLSDNPFTDPYTLNDENWKDGAEADEPEDRLYTLLLVEDNEELLQLMVKLLKREYNIHTAVNGKEAMDLVKIEEIDLIVSDLMMPVMDGLAFCKELKNNINYSHIPFIALTAKKQEEDRAEAYECGVDGYICKPFNLTVLHAKIRNLLSKKERKANEFRRQVVFEIKDLEYNAVDEDFLQRAIESVNRNIEDPEFDLQQLADDLQTSKTNLYRKLKSLTGLAPASFIRNIRMKAACKLMSEKKNLRISEIAYAVGFKDAKYFSTCFRKEFGMQPKEFISQFTEFDRSAYR